MITIIMMELRMVATIIMKDDQDEENADQSGLVVGRLTQSSLFCSLGLQPDHDHDDVDDHGYDHDGFDVDDDQDDENNDDQT